MEDDRLKQLRRTVAETKELVARTQRTVRDSMELLELARAMSSPLVAADPLQQTDDDMAAAARQPNNVPLGRVP